MFNNFKKIVEIALIFLVVIIILSIVDLTVGVANDAVNFLNSAVGSKVTTFRKALFVASIGILIGVTLSSGMMEIARKGIFNPGAFTLYQVLIIFLATVITDILLLDFFNTFGIPTSTTVSMISGMTGGALGITIINLISKGESFEMTANYLNLAKLTAIYFSIIVSIVFAFIFGYLGQFTSRLIFSFDYNRNFKKYGPLWASFAFTFIILFISMKGLEGASFVNEQIQSFINTYRWQILLIIYVSFSLIFYLLSLFPKINILKSIVLIGTAAIALAFASNDLVNFVGPGLTALYAYQIAGSSADALNMKMGGLANPIKVQTEILLFCGAVMVLTLFFSKKARTVTSTEVNLGRQVEGYEAFESIPFARFLVRTFTAISDFLVKIVPEKIRTKVNERFDTSKVILLKDENGAIASFDMIRATVNLTIASALISLGTSLKLPLSTTYITFIVAMSTAFADRAWGRDYAVYRISGILTVIGGWLITALICALIAAIISSILYFTGVIGVIILVSITIISVARTIVIHKKREKKRKIEEEKLRIQKETTQESFIIFVSDVYNFLNEVKEISLICVSGIAKFKLKELRKAKKRAEELNKSVETIFSDFASTLKMFDDRAFEGSHIYASAMSDITSVANSILTISERCFNYVDNSQKPLTQNQLNDLKLINKLFEQLYNKILTFTETSNADLSPEIKVFEEEFSKEIKRIHKTYMKAMKRPGANTKRGIIYISLVETLYGISKRVSNLVATLNNLKVELSKNYIQVN